MGYIRSSVGLVALLYGMVACGQQEKPQPQKADKAAYSTPSYVDTLSFSETSITLKSDTITLPGTLTLPNGSGPFPAIVLVQGSGPSDRDETISANKPFRDLAWGLASKGIAVLRYDKRTKVAPYSFLNKVFTVKEEVTDDALQAVQLLRHSAKIDPNALFVLGHSLGATLAPRIAAEDGKLKGIVVMAGTTRPFEDILSDQGKYLASLDTSSGMQFQRAMLDTIAAKIRRLTSSDSLNPASIAGAPAAYYLDFRAENAPRRAAALGINTLVIQGERDYQVTLKDFDVWKAALGNKPNAKLKKYKSLNHLFMEGEGPSSPKEYAVATHIPAYVIDDIANWIIQSKSH